MTDMTFQINDTEFHRNGVGGWPFFTIDFVLTEDGRHQHLWAVVPTSDSDEDGNRLAPADRWQVIDPTRFNSNWRGDTIGWQLKATAEQFIADKSARLHADILAGRA